jgi:dihydroorotate dehydrogenase (fumarate)
VHAAPAAGTGVYADALHYLRVLPDSAPGAPAYLALVAAARDALRIPVIASLNGTTPGGWTEHARSVEQAGATALELNLYHVAADPDASAGDVEARALELIAAVRATVRIPLAVKLGPYYTAFGHFARAVVAAGADGLVLFNRFYQPDLDLDDLEVSPHLVLSRSEELRLPLRWIGILRRRVAASLAASSGVHGVSDVVKALLAGADAAMLASALLQHGPGHLRTLEAALARWLEEREYESVEQMKGSLSQAAVPNPDSFERANYRRTLRSWSSEFHS